MYGDWWVYPDGSCQDMGQGEHAEVALRTMLKMPEGMVISRRQLYSMAFTKDQIQEALVRDVELSVIKFIEESGDPRYYAIKVWGWIRIAKTKINCWNWRESAQDILRRSSYWSQQPDIIPQDMFDVEDFYLKRKFSITVEKILGGADLGVGAVEPEAKPLFVPPARGMHTDTASPRDWRYRRIGDNKE